MNTRSLLAGAMAYVCCVAMSFAAKQGNFNPDISLIMDGRYGSYSNNGTYELPGFMLGTEASRGGQGFHLGHNELVISANIDDMFYGKFTTAITDHEGSTEVELEEAFIETLAIGHGVTIKAGRFYSDIGYLNNQHGHAWDFVDAPLIYRGLFANQLIDDGLQISWVVPTDLYFKVGAASTRGERFPAGGAQDEGKGATTLFAKLGGDVGISHAWQFGLSYWNANVNGRTAGTHAHSGRTETPTFSGDSKIYGIDFVWKWAPDGNKRETNLKIQAEYFKRDEDGTITLAGSSPLETSTYMGEQSGLYLQAVYQFMPRWRVGVRYDQLKADNTGADASVLEEAGLHDKNHTPERSSIMLDYSHSEYSRVRLQYAKDDSYKDSDNLIFMQYVVTLGAHGAHRF
ncbi:MAG: porin [Gammaproteobacteria bacterium]|nr:porin [Gammaproteobacteria bacterium]